MAITAHPQDLAERTGGTVAKHIERGDEVMWVSLTSGVVTHAFNVFPAEGEDKLKDFDKIKEMKRQELERAADILGVQHWHFLDFPENPTMFGYDEYKTVIELMRSFRPDIVITQHPWSTGGSTTWTRASSPSAAWTTCGRTASTPLSRRIR